MEQKKQFMMEPKSEGIQERSYALSHARLSMAKQENNKLVKRQILNLDAIVRVEIETEEGRGFFKADESYLLLTGLSADELWEAAYRNTAKNLQIFTLEEMLGLPEGLLDDVEDETDVPFYVCTTKDKISGAAALCCPKVFKDFCEAKGLNEVFLVPSSTEELLIVQKMGMDLSQFAQMVDDINNSAVEPELRLEPVIYSYNRKDNSLVIAAKAKQLKAV